MTSRDRLLCRSQPACCFGSDPDRQDYPRYVFVFAEAIWDTEADVKKAVRDSFERVTAVVSNKDIVGRFVPALNRASP